MKKLILFVYGSFIYSISFGQMNFKWDMTDSIPKTKSQIYSATKMFIGEMWKSSKDVIQNDDKETGIILVKGVSVQKFMISMGLCPMEYIYDYNVTFRMKDGKFKITIDQVHCTSAHGGTSYLPVNELEPSDEIPYPFKTGGAISKKRAESMMVVLKLELQIIVDGYIKYLHSPTKTSEDW